MFQTKINFKIVFVRDLKHVDCRWHRYRITRETKYHISDQIKKLADDLSNYMCKKVQVISHLLELFKTFCKEGLVCLSEFLRS